MEQNRHISTTTCGDGVAQNLKENNIKMVCHIIQPALSIYSGVICSVEMV